MDHTEVCEELEQKVKELKNPNIAENNARKIEIWTGVYEIYLSGRGRLFLEDERERIVRHRWMLKDKIAELACADGVENNAAYLEKAGKLKEVLEGIERGDPRQE
jgi:hypothetical protein